ncbi:hypothetical protein T440DRAFT_518120 [Plenodomus tracheiphilus IPT5]|uniref:Uncharacterized protein n=1 Tax=Plenodomus tracheiphilus IPT5 TaxID=1408161 RepID=A0A6A7B678_9PLEO|nr:hypothetical protein T440DRAFT_518120 [Plenodomus tracheiphilus IPT5]
MSTKRAMTDPEVAENDKKAKIDTIITALEDPLSAPPITSKAQPTLPSIPREIRDMIWEYAIAGHEITPRAVGNSRFTVKASAYNEGVGTVENWKKLNSLSLTNRQIREETKLLPFSLSVVNNVSVYEFGDWLFALHYMQRGAIRTISIGSKYKSDSDSYRSVYSGDHSQTAIPGEMCELYNLQTILLRRETLSMSQIENVEATVKEMDGVKLIGLCFDGREISYNEGSMSQDEDEMDETSYDGEIQDSWEDISEDDLGYDSDENSDDSEDDSSI